MLRDPIRFILFIAVLVLGFLLLLKSCQKQPPCPDADIDTVTVEKIIYKPQPVAVRPITRDSLRERILGNNGRTHIPLPIAFGPDSLPDETGGPVAAVDLDTDADCCRLLDSIGQLRTYIDTTQNQYVRSITTTDALGYIEKFTNRLEWVQQPKALPMRSLSAGFIAGTDTTLAGLLIYADRRGRNFMGGYDILNKSIKGGITFTIFKR